MTKPRAVLFDFDFTLADSSKGVFESMRGAFIEMSYAVPCETEIATTIGLPLHVAFEQLTGVSDRVAADDFVDRFHRHADEFMEKHTTVYAAVEPVMVRLRATGARTAIISTKRHGRIDGILTSNGLRELFDAIVGGDDVAHHKPDPEGLLLALEELDVELGSAVYVGDHIVDAQAAQAAGIDFIAALSGVHAEQDFKSYPCLAVVGGIDEVPAVFRLG